MWFTLMKKTENVHLKIIQTFSRITCHKLYFSHLRLLRSIDIINKHFFWQCSSLFLSLYCTVPLFCSYSLFVFALNEYKISYKSLLGVAKRCFLHKINFLRPLKLFLLAPVLSYFNDIFRIICVHIKVFHLTKIKYCR